MNEQNELFRAERAREQEKARRFVAENFDHSEGLAADRVLDNLILKKPMGGQ